MAFISTVMAAVPHRPMKLKLFGITVTASFPVVAVMTLVLVFDRQHHLTVCFLSAVLHECGHLLAMYLCRCRPSALSVKLFDVKILDNYRATRPFKQDVLITLAGPAANILAFGVLFVCYVGLKNQIFLQFAIINVSIGLFNLLPVATLDGGQAIYLLLIQKVSHKTASLVLDILTVILIFPTAVLGILILFHSKYNFSLLFISVYLIFALVLKKSKFL